MNVRIIPVQTERFLECFFRLVVAIQIHVDNAQQTLQWGIVRGNVLGTIQFAQGLAELPLTLILSCQFETRHQTRLQMFTLGRWSRCLSRRERGQRHQG